MSKEYTKEEVRNKLLDHIWSCVNYWNDESRRKNTIEKLEGLAFSILVALDGGTELPSFVVAPDPHPDDKEYHIESNKNYYPENYKSDIKCNISGGLHELFYGRRNS